MVAAGATIEDGEHPPVARPAEKGSRRSVSIAPTRNAAGRGTDCSRETG